MTERRAIWEFRSLLCGVRAVLEDEAVSDRALARLAETEDLLKRTDGLCKPTGDELRKWSEEIRKERWLE